MLWILTTFDKYSDFNQSFHEDPKEIISELESLKDSFDEDIENDIKSVQELIEFLNTDGFKMLGYHFKNHLNQFINIEKHNISFDKEN